MAIARSLRAISGAALTGALVLTPATTAAADDVRDKQWPLSTLEAKKVWEVTKGEGQVVAVIDDGVKADHPDLEGNVLKGKDFIDNDSDASPASGEDHGTGIASLIAGHGHGPGNSNGIMGLAPEAKILPIRDDASGSQAGAPSIRYAVDHGATVINISQGGGIFTQEEQEAVAYALEKNVPVFAGTGNSGKESIDYPAAFKGVAAVSGVNKDGSFWKNSNTGPQTLLAGPASRVLSASAHDESQYQYGTGTSDSTAYASASAALLRSEFPDLTAGQIVNRLTKTAVPPNTEKETKLPDEKYGYGAIQPLAALIEDIPKGSKYGPLSVPEAAESSDTPSGIETDTPEEIAAGQEAADQKTAIIWTVIGVVGVAFIALIILVIVLVRKKKKNRDNGPGGPNWPGGPGAPGGPMPYGQPPHQQQPGMPPVPPQQPGGHPAPPQQPPRS